MKRRKKYGWWKQRVGTLKPYIGKYSYVRLKRNHKGHKYFGRKVKGIWLNKYSTISVQIKNKKGEWKTIDTFTSENDAVEFLCEVANHLEVYRHIVGDFD